MCRTKSNLLHGGPNKNILPTKANLGHRRVLDDPTCEACGVAAESSGHFFWDCDKASEIWKLSGIPFDARGAHFQDFKDLLWHVMLSSISVMRWSVCSLPLHGVCGST